MKNELLIVLLVSIVLLFGCTQPDKPLTKTKTSEPPKENTTIIKPPVTETFQPLKLDYEFNEAGLNGVPDRKLFFTLWLNERKDCSGKKAFLGILRTSEDSSKADDLSMWSKVTVFEDDGTMAISMGRGKNELAFDDAQSANLDFDFFLTLNNMFVSIGKNFNTDKIWESTTPVLLKNVQFGNEFANISVMKGDESTDFVVPCTEFTLLEQGQGLGEMKACVAKVSKKMPLPFIVSYVIDKEFEIKLVKASNEKSSAIYYPQCLERIKCEPVERPLQKDYETCNLKNGNLDPITDEKNCVIKYECRTERDRASADLIQPLECNQPSNAIIDKLIECRNTDNGNWQIQTDQIGCITDIVCGEMMPAN